MLNKLIKQDLGRFFGEIWGQRGTTFHLNEDEKIPFSLEKLEYILKFYPLNYENLKVFGDGGVIPIQQYTKSVPNQLNTVIDKAKLLHPQFLRDKTLVINSIQQFDPELLAFNKKLREAFGCEVNMNLYYTVGTVNGVNAHYDQHHIFAAQLDGKKTWSLGEIVVENPSATYAPYVGEQAFQETIETKAGDILYIPPGQWHSVKTDDYSLHLAIGIHPPTWEKLIQKAVEKAVEQHSIVRADIPFHLSDDGKVAYESDYSREMQLLLDLVGKVSEGILQQPTENEDFSLQKK